MSAELSTDPAVNHQRQRKALIIGIPAFVVCQALWLYSAFRPGKPSVERGLDSFFHQGGLLLWVVLLVGLGQTAPRSGSPTRTPPSVWAGRAAALNVGYWALILSIAIIEVIAAFKPIATDVALRILMLIGITVPALRILMLDQRANRPG